MMYLQLQTQFSYMQTQLSYIQTQLNYIKINMKSGTEQFTKAVFSYLDVNSNNSGGKLASKIKKNKINLFGKGITNVKLLTQQQISYFNQITELDISHNAIYDFQNLKVLPFWQINLSHNKLQDQQKIKQVFVQDKNCQLSKNINKILLKGNPFLKKQLQPELKRWLFSVQNDLELFTKQENQFLQLLVQRFTQKICLQNILNKIQINTQLIHEFDMDISEEYQQLLLVKPQEYFKTVRRQMQWKLQVNPLFNIKKQVVSNLPIQLFKATREKTQMIHYVPPLAIELRTRNQNLIKLNKQTMKKIENGIFNYLILRKMNVQRRHKNKLSLNQLNKTPFKQISNIKPQENPSINTPIYAINYSPNKNNCQEVEQVFHFNLSQSNQPKIMAIESQRQQRNPFGQIVSQAQEQNCMQTNYKVKNAQKQNQFISTLNAKKTDVNNGSKTLFQLSESLLKQNIVSDESLNFELQQESQSQIQRMFHQILTKLNPIYHLLYSPVQSLKASQKSSLITNLLQLLKQKLKYILKIKKFKFLYQQLSESHQQLNFRYAKEKNSSEVLTSDIKQMKKQLTHMEQDIQRLSKQIQEKTQQNMLIKENNTKLIDQVNKWKDAKFFRQQEQNIQETIRSKRQSMLKKSYLYLVSKKAQKLVKFQTNTNQIKNLKNNLLAKECFAAVVRQVINSKNHRQVKNTIISNRFQSFLSTLESSISLNKATTQKTMQCLKFFRIQKVRKLISKLNQNQAIKIQNKISQNHCKNHLKSNSFRILKINLQFQKTIHYDKLIEEFRIGAKQRFKKLVFKEWLIWQKGLVLKETQIRTNHEVVLACNIIGRLSQHYSKQMSHQTKSVAMELYLRDIRKLNSFHQFYLHISLKAQTCKLKIFKINLFSKRVFFDGFLSGIRNKRLKIKIKSEDEALIKRKLQFNELSELKLKRAVFKTKIKLRNCYFQHVKKQITFFKRQMDVKNKVFLNKTVDFLDSIKLMHRDKISFKSKKRQLHYSTKGYREGQSHFQQFNLQKVFIYWRRQQKFKRNFNLFFMNKDKKFKSKTFNQMRISYLEQKALYFEQKLRELGPDIKLIEQRQIQTNIEKIGLLRQMEMKEQLIEEYETQVNQLKKMLQAQEIKYQKLKDIYTENIKINSRQRDFYELDNSIVPQYFPYQLGRSNLISTISSKQDNILKTLKYDSKFELHCPTSTYTKCSPERDVRKSRENQKIKDLVTQSKKANDQIYRQKNQLKGYHKEEISQFYPSFRRF